MNDHPLDISPPGIRANLGQFLTQLALVMLVGMTLGMVRTVVPVIAESEFGVRRGSFMLLVAFVVAFGLVKGTMNLVAGRLAETWGRKWVLLTGWLVVVPVPLLIYFSSSWTWVVVATVLLGINQGLAWSMTQTAKLDFTRPDQRGLVIGLNEFSGYLGLATAGIVTAYLATSLGAREGILVFGLAVILLALLLTALSVTETRHRVTKRDHTARSTAELFRHVTWDDRRLAALCQAGLVEKFVDALVWLFWPLYLYRLGQSLPVIGWVVGVYGVTWGTAQLVTGPLSDRFGRHPLNVWGMWVCGAGVAVFPFASGQLGWSLSACVTGLGMAMLYPNLSAAVADLADPAWRASAIGIYRFWRDLGYGIGALGLGAAATFSDSLEAGFWFVSLAMAFSGAVLARWGAATTQR